MTIELLTGLLLLLALVVFAAMVVKFSPIVCLLAFVIASICFAAGWLWGASSDS